MVVITCFKVPVGSRVLGHWKLKHSEENKILFHGLPLYSQTSFISSGVVRGSTEACPSPSLNFQICGIKVHHFFKLFKNVFGGGDFVPAPYYYLQNCIYITQYASYSFASSRLFTEHNFTKNFALRSRNLALKSHICDNNISSFSPTARFSLRQKHAHESRL